MLILNRKEGEAIFVGDNVKVVILGARGNSVRLGIEAPKEVPVHREEVYEEIQREKIKK